MMRAGLSADATGPGSVLDLVNCDRYAIAIGGS
jgi:hypothetical protein